MPSFVTARRLVRLYALAGLGVGIAFSLWCFWDELQVRYRGPDGTLARKAEPPRLVSWIDPDTGQTVVGMSRGSQRLTVAERAWGWSLAALPILLASSGVGIAWGVAHLGIRAVLYGPPADPGWADYDDLAGPLRSPPGVAVYGSMSVNRLNGSAPGSI